MKRALITGITGQDGSYLAELLLDKDYEVHGIVRRVASEKLENRFSRLSNCINKIKLHSASLENFASLYSVISKVQPDECYHLASQSYIGYSFDDSFSTMNINVNGTQFLLESIYSIAPQCRFFFASSSEMFGKVNESPQHEKTCFHPRSPYGISKVAGFNLTRNYREAHDLFACSGILFNHESPRRGFEFVTRKITIGAARISIGQEKKLRLGNLDASRDWGFAQEYVKAMWLMLQHSEPQDFVIATGCAHTVREFVAIAFAHVGLDWSEHVVVDPELYRPADVDFLLGNPHLARVKLGWQPTTTFEELVKMMVDHELSRW